MAESPTHPCAERASGGCDRGYGRPMAASHRRRRPRHPGPAAPRPEHVERREPLHRLVRRRPDRPRSRGGHRSGSELMADAGILPDVVHTSLGCGPSAPPTRRSTPWSCSGSRCAATGAPNERHYGDLQGRNKKETADKYGIDQVKVWRRSYATPPPPLDRGDERSAHHDPATPTSPPTSFPAGVPEGRGRAHAPLLVRRGRADLRAGRVTLLAAHGNSLRALVRSTSTASPTRTSPSSTSPPACPSCSELGADLQPLEAVPHRPLPRPRGRRRSRRRGRQAGRLRTATGAGTIA